jgi:hypothetical protein
VYGLRLRGGAGFFAVASFCGRLASARFTPPAQAPNIIDAFKNSLLVILSVLLILNETFL